MARRNPDELGQRETYTFRYDADMPVKGMRRRGDPASVKLPFWAFLRNVRFSDGITERPSGKRMLTGLGAGAEDTEVISLYDFQPTAGSSGDGGEGTGGQKLWVVYFGCPGQPVGPLGFSLNTFDYDQQRALSNGLYWSTTTNRACLGKFGGNLYVGRDDSLSIYTTINPDYDTESIFLTGLDQAEALKTFTGFTINWLKEFDGNLYIGLDNGAGSGKVMQYDGVTFRQDDTGHEPTASAVVFRDEFLIYGRQAGGIRQRTKAGVWSTVAGAVVPLEFKSYRDKLFISENTKDLWSYDGTTLAIVHSVTVGGHIQGLEEAFGYLFYGFDSSTSKATIGRLDSAGTYVDAHKVLSNQTGFSWTLHVPKLVFFRGALIAAVEPNPAATPPANLNGGRLFSSRNVATSGTWDIVTPVDGTADPYYDIVDLEVY